MYRAETLIEIRHVTVTDTDFWRPGELIEVHGESDLRDYLKEHGHRGFADLLQLLSQTQGQVIDIWKELQKEARCAQAVSKPDPEAA